MDDNEILLCLIALIIGYLAAKVISGNGFTIGGQYSCSDTECIENEDGEYDNDDCDGRCLLDPNYSCSGTKCIEDEGGEYDNDDCDDKCVPITYSCSGTECIVKSNGDYTDDECDDECNPWYKKYWWVFLIIGIVFILIIILIMVL